MANRNKNYRWLKEQTNINISHEDEMKILDTKKLVRGIYGIFIEDNGFEKCVYVGRSNSIYGRLFKNGHVTKLRNGNHPSIKLTNAIINNMKITIRILKEVPYLFDDYYKDMQRLASEECRFIDEYQSNNQCLEQVPEGTQMMSETWRRLKTINGI